MFSLKLALTYALQLDEGILHVITNWIKGLWACPICFNFWPHYLDKRSLDYSHPSTNPKDYPTVEHFRKLENQFCPHCRAHFNSLFDALAFAKQTPLGKMFGKTLYQLKHQRTHLIHLLDPILNNVFHQKPLYEEPYWALPDLMPFVTQLSEHFERSIVYCKDVHAVILAVKPTPLPNFPTGVSDLVSFNTP